MTFATFLCTGCGRRALVDNADGIGFCMYCGAPAPMDEAVELDPQSSMVLEVVIGGTEEEEQEVNPCLDLIAGAVELMESGDCEAAATAFKSALAGQNPEIHNDMKEAMTSAVDRWVIGTVFDGGAYRGGILPIAELLREGDEEDTSPPVLIESLVGALLDSAPMISDGAVAYNLVESTYVLAAEYFLTEPALDRQFTMVESFIAAARGIEQSSRMTEDQSEPVEVMCSAAECLYAAILDRMPGITEEDLDRLETLWMGKGMSEVGNMAVDILTRVYDESFDDSDEFWERMEADSRTYVETYLDGSS
ncbi:MAG: hypothetical protein Q4Q58_06895 [Thermoplasmata archaeon]|nr:hypothetical protein [Thermoplasmata archaeon]